MGGYLLILLAIALAWQLAGCAMQRRVLFPTYAIPPELQEPDPGIAGLVKLDMPTDAGVTEAWFIPAEGASADHPQPAVLFAHGNAELIDIWPQYLEPYRRLGVSVMLIEYRGYGRSDGTPSQKTLTEDFAAGYDLLAGRQDVDAGRIVFHGRSVGGGIVCALAGERKPAALILQSTFTSVSSMALRFGILPPFVSDPFDNASALRAYDGPVLLMHGRDDSIIPHRHSEKLLKLARRGTLKTYDCGHNDFPITSDRYWSDIADFLRAAQIIDPA